MHGAVTGVRLWANALASSAIHGPRRWTIVCWHAVGGRDQFRRTLDEMLEFYEPVPLSGGHARLQSRGIRKPLLSLTFDDADRTVYQYCLPELRSRSLSACLFVTTGFVDKGYHETPKGRRPVMSWPELQEWAAAALELGGHTVNHIPLNQASMPRAQWEVLESKRILEQRLGCKVRHFAYPGGYYTDQLQEWLEVGVDFDTVLTTYPQDNFPGQGGKHLHRKPPPRPGRVSRDLTDCGLYAAVRHVHHRELFNGLAPVLWYLPADSRRDGGEQL